MKRLLIGANVGEHDSSIFVIDPVRQEITALATERLTRYKRDIVYALERIRKRFPYTSAKLFRNLKRILSGRLRQTTTALMSEVAPQAGSPEIPAMPSGLTGGDECPDSSVR